MSTLLKWAQNTTQGKLGGGNKNNTNNGSSSNSSSSNSTNGTVRKWLHPAEALQKGHIAYLVKFLGNTVVDQPKGIEVVKEGIRKLRFNQQLRKSENGAKTRKVELTISIDGVAIQEPRTHVIMHQFPLHRISYCADDKGEKKFFSFIAKQPNQVDNDAEETHECFVFISDKLAEEITLTIGQAFELAYKRFLETSGRDLETQRRAMMTQQKMKRLEQENNVYKQRLLELSHLNAIRSEIDQYLRRKNIKSLLEVTSQNHVTEEYTNGNGGNKVQINNLVELNGAPPIPPRTIDNNNMPTVGTKLEGLLLNEFDPDNDFDPRSFEQSTNGNNPPLIAPPPKAARRTNINNNNETRSANEDLFGSSPFCQEPILTSSSTSTSEDPFEMGDFNNTATSQDIEHAIGILNKRILEMKTGFSRGISFGNDDFSLESLDPLKN